MRAAVSAPEVAGAGASRLRPWFAALNVAGGLAVLGSYAVGLAAHPQDRGAVWGGVPDDLRPIYTACMLLAAAGYFLFTRYVYFEIPSQRVRVFGRFGFGAFLALYAAILLPSALWMPLTFRMLERPGISLWIAIRAVLLIVGGASLGLVEAVRTAEPRGTAGGRRLALVGAFFFALQTAVLDALVWPAYFPGG